MRNVLEAGDRAARRYHPAIQTFEDCLRIAVRVTLPIVVALFAGCGSDFGPGSGTTRYYRLDTVDGRSLPTVFDSAATSWYSVGADTLVLDGASDTVREVFHGWETSTLGPVHEYSGTTTSVYEVHGDSIEIIPNTTCPPTCFADRGGHISESALTLRFGGDTSQNPAWIYRRVSAPR